VDSDTCLQQSSNWSASSVCAGNEIYCTSYDKDMHRCCPLTCGTGELTEAECNALTGTGDCTYPNDAQKCCNLSHIIF